MPYDPARPTVYLDWSHVSGAFSSTCEAAYSDQRPLFDLVLQVSAEANLCLSAVHVAELMAHPKRDIAMATAEWIDTLNVTWMESDADDFQEREREWALLSEFGASRARYVPFLQSFVQLFARNLSREQREHIQRNPRLSVMLVHTAGHPGIQELRKRSLEGAEQLWHDGKRAQREGLSEQQIRTALVRKEHDALYDLLWSKGRELRHKNGFRAAGLTEPDDDTLHATCERLADDPRCCPAFRMGMAAAREFRFSILRQNINSTKFKRHASATFDWQHYATGAAYCDVFACDYEASRYTSGCRAELGKMRQLSTHECGGFSEFASAVRGQLRALASQAQARAPV